ncbi:MAG: preprotein translocase subunit SecE [Lachnospiraceae bacterium]|jgi:preprotein translocase subunit SecE|nr:preprotein translocase subunit SecE [Lachnospiraceae bacterium]MDD3616240.1 preprotein translocase subunit SecE [Lachnospiraceae bacterium]
MADAVKTDKAPKKSWFKGLKSEFNKIIWTDKQTLGKQTVAVVVISILLGVIIAVVDSLALQGINFLIK